MAGSLRSPICVVAGHVDHGKSSILDTIRGSSVVEGEAGAITQAIGASLIPLEKLKAVCHRLIKDFKLTIPGVLFIDTPGHAAFTNLRKRGGNLADIAILVVDMNEGFKPQTIEALEILKTYKTPFIVAANKLDLLPGWQTKGKPVLPSIADQFDGVKTDLDKKLYELVGRLAEFGFNSERFDRVEDASKQVLIVPCSAKTGDGIPELIMALSGLTQRYLEECISCNVEGMAKGTILEVKEVKGTGTVIDVVIYDGSLHVNDQIVVGAIPEPFVTKVRAIFEPKVLSEIRDKKASFASVKESKAASAVRIVAPGLEGAVGGMPVVAVLPDKVGETVERIKSEIEEVLIETDKDGIVLKADSLGSLEALVQMLRERDVMIKRASIGNISKKDTAEAESSVESHPEHAVVLGFSVQADVQNDNVTIITSDVIYKLIEDFERWQEELKKRLEEKELITVGKPFKIELLRGYVFRQSNPAVAGVEVLAGKMRAGAPLMKDGREIDTVKAIQQDSKTVSEAEKGKQVAVSFPKCTIGRQLNEGDKLYSFINEESFRKLKEFKTKLSADEIKTLKEIAAIMRKENPLWGV